RGSAAPVGAVRGVKTVGAAPTLPRRRRSASALSREEPMDTHHLDTPCGFCAGQGHREISGGAWIPAPVCPDCGGTGYLVISEDGERLLAFVQRHLGRTLQQEIADLRAEVVITPAADEKSRPHG